MQGTWHMKVNQSCSSHQTELSSSFFVGTPWVPKTDLDTTKSSRAPSSCHIVDRYGVLPSLKHPHNNKLVTAFFSNLSSRIHLFGKPNHLYAIFFADAHQSHHFSQNMNECTSNMAETMPVAFVHLKCSLVCPLDLAPLVDNYRSSMHRNGRCCVCFEEGLWL